MLPTTKLKPINLIPQVSLRIRILKGKRISRSRLLTMRQRMSRISHQFYWRRMKDSSLVGQGRRVRIWIGNPVSLIVSLMRKGTTPVRRLTSPVN